MRNNHHPPDPTPSRARSHSRTPSEPRLAGSEHPRARRLQRRLWLLTLVGAVGVVLAVAAPAFAGTWVQVSCVNPDNSAAPSEGWTGYTGGGTGDGSTNSTQCAPGSPMFAILSTTVAAPVGAGE